MKNFIIAAICLSATLASNAPGKDKKHIQAAQDTTAYHGAVLRFPNGNGSILSIGPFPIILPPAVIHVETEDVVPARPTRSAPRN
jgi:hypothetical protein